MPPVDETFFAHKRSFFNSVKRHDFLFVRDALELDASLISSPTSYHHSLV
jgi:hypothetical protein